MSPSGSGGTRTPPRAPAMSSGGPLPADGPALDAQSGPSTPPARMHRSVDVLSPHTTFYTSTSRPPLQRQAAMSLLLKTAEGRERSLRALQNILRFYVYFRTRSVTSAAGRPTGKTTRLLLLVFLLSSIRKLRNLSELISPLVPTGLSKQRIHRFAGTQDLAPEGLGWSRAVGSSIDEGKGDDKAAPARHVSTTKWYWTEKHAWADVSASASSSSSRVCPPASDHASLLLRHRLDGLETTLSLLDTVADGVALFARFGITVTIPFALLRRMIAPSAESGSKRNNSFLYRTFRRAETLADVFWLTGTVLSLFETELERREVWQFGKNVRRSMRDEEVLRAHADRLREALTATIGPASIASGEGDTPSASKEEQLLALDEADQACAAHIKSQRRALRDLRGRLTWLWWERVRLGADGVFALYDVFEFSSGSEAVRAVAGTVSAAVGFSQIWSESLRLARRGSH